MHEIHEWHELKDILCGELQEVKRGMKHHKDGRMGMGDIEIVHKLTDTIKNIDKIIMLEESGYSYGRDDDISMRRGRSHDSYARYADDMSGRRGKSRDGSMHHMSRDSAKDEIFDELEEMLDSTKDSKIRETVMRCMDMIKNM